MAAENTFRAKGARTSAAKVLIYSVYHAVDYFRVAGHSSANLRCSTREVVQTLDEQGQG
jgi:hypothetical protein